MTKKKTERGSLEFYLEQKYPVTLYPDNDGGFVAEIKDLPGCMTQGDSADEALEEIEDARISWIKVAHEHSDYIPLPSTETQYSGKTLLRMPRSLHQRLAEWAEQEGVSLNQYIVSLLSAALASENTNRSLKASMETVAEAIRVGDVERSQFLGSFSASTRVTPMDTDEDISVVFVPSSAIWQLGALAHRTHGLQPSVAIVDSGVTDQKDRFSRWVSEYVNAQVLEKIESGANEAVERIGAKVVREVVAKVSKQVAKAETKPPSRKLSRRTRT
jgi:antitoxin HicB